MSEADRGHLCSPGGCRAQCDAACRPALAHPWATYRAARDLAAVAPGLGAYRSRWSTTWSTGGTRHADPLAGRLRLRPMPGSAERRSQGTPPTEGASAAPHRGAKAGPGCDLRRQTIQDPIRDFGLTANQVWGLTKTDADWATAPEAALTAMRRDDLKHRTGAASVAGCVCGECREHQRKRMARNRK